MDVCQCPTRGNIIFETSSKISSDSPLNLSRPPHPKSTASSIFETASEMSSYSPLGCRHPPHPKSVASSIFETASEISSYSPLSRLCRRPLPKSFKVRVASIFRLPSKIQKRKAHIIDLWRRKTRVRPLGNLFRGGWDII